MGNEQRTSLTVNGSEEILVGDAGVPLLVALREQLDLQAVRPGCRVGECGACTVLLDGVAVQSCQVTIADVSGRDVLTPEGLRTEHGDHPVLQAFLDLEAAQCGYRVNGIMMRVAGLIDAPARPTDMAGLAAALEGQLCRCGTHARLLEAAASVLLRGEAPIVSTCELRRCDACLPQGPGRAGEDLPPLVAGSPDVADWLEVTPGGRIVVLTGRSEIGQAVHTALRQIVAAHLGISTAVVDVLAPTTARSRDEGFTAGSKSVMEGGEALAMAATALRRLVLERAAARSGAPIETLKLEDDGSVVTPDATTLTLRSLAEEPFVGAITSGDAPDWRLSGLGEPERRRDLESKLTGPAFVHDGRLLMVIAERESAALRAAAALESRTRWDDPGISMAVGVIDSMRAQPSRPFVVREDAGVDDALVRGRRLAASYTEPHHSHGSMSPSAGVAWLRDGALEVWSHTQGVHQLRKELITLLGDRVDDVIVHHSDGPGSYRQNGAVDAAALVALAALAVPGRPVRLHLGVTDEFRWEPYGTAMAADLEAAIDETGRVLGWRHRTLTDGHMNRPAGQGDRTVAAWLPEGGAQPPAPPVTEGGARNIVHIYAFPAVHAVADHTLGPLRSASLRSLGSFHNVFAQESFMDEVAEAAGADPVAFRLAHLDDRRAREVLEAAAEAAGWTPRVGPSGRGLGVALARYHDEMGYAAVVAEVEVDVDADRLAVKRLVIAADLGTVINPEGARQQLEGGALQGVSRTLFEELRVDRRGVRTESGETYPVLRFTDVPRIDVILLDRRGAQPLGAGEVSTPPVSAAIANALDDATGVRVRDLPITLDALRERVLRMDDAELARVRVG